MNFKKIVAFIIVALMLVTILPIQSAEYIHTHALESESETDVEIKNFAPGDLNGDGSFAAEDLALVRGVLLDVVTDSEIKDAVDCNGDFDSDLVDLVRLKKHIANDIGSEPFAYELDSDGNAMITGFDNSVHGAVTVPSEIDGHKVTAIGEGAFEDAEDLTSVLIPNSVSKIERNAFAGCENLMGTSLPNSIEEIGDDAFKGCSSMPNIRLSENIIEIGDGAFSYCSSLIEIDVPDKVTILNNRAFEGCSALIFIGLPENLKEIKTYTFYGCEKLESVSIPITVVVVEDHAFDSCESLLSVVVPYETAFGDNVFANCGMLILKGYAGTGAIDAAINSGAKYEILECGHSDYAILYAVNPTCNKVGYSGDVYCASCGKIEQKGAEIPKSAHIPEIVLKEDATCEEYGYTGDTACTVCNKTIDYGDIIYPTGHYASNIDYIAIEPTCTTDGKYGTFTCEYCNEYIDGRVISKLGHNLYEFDYKHPNCVEDGYSGDTRCVRKGCDYIIKGHTLPKGDHYYELTNYRSATCTEDGYSGDMKCTGCDDVNYYGTVTNKKGHKPITDNYKAATCTENGYSGDSYCSDCGTKISTGMHLPLLGHKSVIINYLEPTCTEDGNTGHQVCSVCGVLVAQGNTIEKLGHKLVLKNQKDCSATESGYTGDLVCETCGEVIESGKIIPANHTHTMEITNVVEPTCEKTGYTGDSTCSVCGYVVNGTVVPMKSHVITVTVVAPECAKNGYTVDECVNCDYERKYATTEALGHNWDEEWTIDKYATCTVNGEQHKNCSRCDEKLIETINSKGHTLGEVQNAVESTCSAEGYTGDRICSVCGETVKGEIIAKKSHKYGNWMNRCYHSGDNTSGDSLGGIVGGGIGGIVGGTHQQLTANDYVERYKVCSACGNEISDRINSGDSMFTEDNSNAATCTESGYTLYDCKYCDYNYKKSSQAIGHNCSKIVTNPTCTEQGYTTYSCKRCDYEYTSDITEPFGHDYSESVTEPTCTEQGYTTYNCNICNYNYISDYVEPIDHCWEFWDSESYCPNCDTYCSHEMDWETQTCINCHRRSCQYCGGFDHSADYYEDCPYMPHEMWCDYCGMNPDHETWNCPFMGGGMWCDYCQMHTDHDTWCCPFMGGGGMGDMWCDNCGCYTDHTTEQIDMCPAAMPPTDW